MIGGLLVSGFLEAFPSLQVFFRRRTLPIDDINRDPGQATGATKGQQRANKGLQTRLAEITSE